MEKIQKKIVIQIGKAIDVFYNQLIGKHDNKPSLWAYKELISVCTKAGRYNDAFKAFDEVSALELRILDLKKKNFI
jgi:pentatricopeptide repeat protein